MVFQGATHLNLDAKGRMAIPTRAREPLTLGGTVKLVLTAHPDGCLLLYPYPAWEPIRQRVMAFPALDRQVFPDKNVWLAILVSLPLSLIGVVLALWITRDTLNIMSLIGVILLMGIVAKNAILLIDFAKWARERGQPLPSAAPMSSNGIVFAVPRRIRNCDGTIALGWLMYSVSMVPAEPMITARR